MRPRGESSWTNVIDIDGLAIAMKIKLDHHCSISQIRKKKAPSICKVQNSIRLFEKNAYDPVLVSIGPYHHGTPSLIPMEKEKWSCLAYVLYLNPKVKLQDYMEVMNTLATSARNSYSEEIQMEENDFLKMLLLDGCYILFTLYGLTGTVANNHDSYEDSSSDIKVEGYNVEVTTVTKGGEMIQNDIGGCLGKERVPDVELTNCNRRQIVQRGTSVEKEDTSCQDSCQPRVSWDWDMSLVSHDLLLLENQIPFFIVKGIYDLVIADHTTTRLLTDNIGKCIEGILYNYPKAIQESERPEDFQHLLHLCHMYFRPCQSVEEEQQCARTRYWRPFLNIHTWYSKVEGQLNKDCQRITNKQKQSCLQSERQLLRWRRAEQYHEAGIEFKKRELSKNSPHSLLDVKFTNGTVEIPLLTIDDKTGYLLRNLIAFEHTFPQFGNSVTAYICFISRLISMSKDVTLLAKRGIIVHQMRSDDEVSVLLSRLGKNVDFDVNANHYLCRLCQAMEEHYQSRLNRWMAWLWQNHFSNPWLSLAVIAGAMVLICTIFQTLFALLAYLQPTDEGRS